MKVWQSYFSDSGILKITNKMDTNASCHQNNTPSSLLSLDILYEYIIIKLGIGLGKHSHM